MNTLIAIFTVLASFIAAGPVTQGKVGKMGVAGAAAGAAAQGGRATTRVQLTNAARTPVRAAPAPDGQEERLPHSQYKHMPLKPAVQSALDKVFPYGNAYYSPGHGRIIGTQRGDFVDPAEKKTIEAEAQNHFKAMVSGSNKVLTTSEKQSLLNDFFEGKGIGVDSPLAQAVRESVIPGQAAESKSLEAFGPEFTAKATLFQEAGRRHRMLPSKVAELVKNSGEAKTVLNTSREQAEQAIADIVHRHKIEKTAMSYPKTPQGDFMRRLAYVAAAKGYAYAYVDYAAGDKVARVAAGSDGNLSKPHRVFHVAFVNGKWEIGLAGKNREGLEGAEQSFRDWLAAGGIPSGDLN